MIVIIDYGMGNLRSAQKGLEKAGHHAVITDNPSVIRNAAAVVLPGVGGRKRIQDFMVDMKVPKELRDGMYIVAIGNEILWIPKGLTKGRFTQNYKVTDETKKVLTLEIDGEL